MTWGTSAPSVLLDVWYNNNIVCKPFFSTNRKAKTVSKLLQANENRRLLLTSIGVPVANLMGLVPSNIFRDQDAPNYIPALSTTAAFGATGIVLTLSLGAYMIVDNKRRDRKQGRRMRPETCPRSFLEKARVAWISGGFIRGLRRPGYRTAKAGNMLESLLDQLLRAQKWKFLSLHRVR